MSTLTDRLYAQALIRPVQPPNRLKSITKLPNGSLEVEQNSGNVFTIGPDDVEFQAFVIYMMFNPEA